MGGMPSCDYCTDSVQFASLEERAMHVDAQHGDEVRGLEQRRWGGGHAYAHAY
eukprot:gene11086-biopygen5604